MARRDSKASDSVAILRCRNGRARVESTKTYDSTNHGSHCLRRLLPVLDSGQLQREIASTLEVVETSGPIFCDLSSTTDPRG